MYLPVQDTTPHFRFISVLLKKWFSGPQYPGCIEVYTQNFHRVGAGRRPISCLFCFRSLSQKKLKQTNKNLFLTMSMYLFNGICFKYLVFLSVAFLLENIRLLLHDSASHKNESWTEAAISSPATEISWGVLRKVSGCLNSLQWELISSMLKVEIYVVGKSVLVFAFPTPNGIAGCRLAPHGPEHPSFCMTHPCCCLWPLCPFHTCAALLRVQRERLTASPYLGRRRFLL